MTPTLPDFLSAMEGALRGRGVPFSRGALQAFVESAWELIADQPDVKFWADRFLEMGAAATVPD
jgi:hypothetical protein